MIKLKFESRFGCNYIKLLKILSNWTELNRFVSLVQLVSN